MKYSLTVLAVIALFISIKVNAEAPNGCPAWLNHTFKQLHSSNQVNICDNYNDKPVLLVNTASHCGFTHQFSGLEALHQKYKDKGFRVIGFSSNDFNQEAKSEEQAATICYENFGVSFTMVAPTSVKGPNANPVFKAISEKSQSPGWNFNKFLVSADGSKVTHYGSSIAPDSDELHSAIEASLQSIN